MSDREEMLKHYSAALDEIFRLRVAAAYEARAAEALLTYASMPKGVRSGLEAARARMRATAKGWTDIYDHVTADTRAFLLRNCDAPQTLNRHEWENR